MLKSVEKDEHVHGSRKERFRIVLLPFPLNHSG